MNPAWVTPVLPVQPAQLSLEGFAELVAAGEGDLSLIDIAERSANPVSESSADSAMERRLFDDLENGRESIFRRFEVEVDQIIKTHIELKTDIWGKRTGQLFSQEAFIVILDLFQEVSGRVPLRDPVGLSFWVYNANSLSRNILGEKMVEYDTQAKEDIVVAFKSIVRAIDSIDNNLGKWLDKVERALINKQHIELIRPYVVDLQLFIWSYRVSFNQLLKSVDGIFKIPTGVWQVSRN